MNEGICRGIICLKKSNVLSLIWMEQVYLGNELFSFTKDFLKKVEDTGREYYFFTNNSSKSQQAYIEKLGKAWNTGSRKPSDDDLHSHVISRIS